LLVKDVTNAEMLELAIVENIQRENLNPMEEAEAYYRLITEFGLTQEQAAARVGKSRSPLSPISYGCVSFPDPDQGEH
jgi:ParB family chromosome partitioning protein